MIGKRRVALWGLPACGSCGQELSQQQQVLCQAEEESSFLVNIGCISSEVWERLLEAGGSGVQVLIFQPMEELEAETWIEG